MANYFPFSSFPSMALLISLFALASLLASPTLSTSNDNTLETTGFKATLSHVDHGKSLTKTELLLRSIQRGEIRQAVTAQPPLQSRSRSRSPSNNIIASLSGAGNHGEYSMNLTIGNPPINHTVYIDTDTDLIWIKQCDKTFSSLSALSCSDNQCKQVGSCSKKRACHYKYQYSATDSVQVDLATANFTFGKNV
ncbi:hypothetical protein CASFOL_032645 [Castilleja foliolosa]|uniref:Peptidase A1 domain-containing protein n=1 Tax=Castilleja foliolosa TaxID=1961234 RepID=A0ABD3C3D4_9LAMI